MQQDTKWPYSGGLAIVTMETKPLWRTVRSCSWRKHLQEKKRFEASLMDDLSGLVSVCNRLQPKQWPVCCTLWTTSVLSNFSVSINIPVKSLWVLHFSFSPTPPRSRFLDVTQRHPPPPIPLFPLLGERCLTSKKRLQGRLELTLSCL